MPVEDLIQQFVQAQTYVLQKLYLHFRVDPHITATDWALQRNDLIARHRDHPFAEIFYPHGFGLQFKDGCVHIDYDYARSGRPNGFDGWRLFLFARENGLRCEYSTAGELAKTLERRHALGQLEQEPPLYFLPGECPQILR